MVRCDAWNVIIWYIYPQPNDCIFCLPKYLRQFKFQIGYTSKFGLNMAFRIVFKPNMFDKISISSNLHETKNVDNK